MNRIPEGASFENLGEDGRLITGVRRKGAKPYAVIPGEIRRKYNEDRDWSYDAAREGEPPQSFRIANMNLVEKRTKQRFVRPDMFPDSIDMPTQTVKIVGHNTIAPATDDPDFDLVNEGVLMPTAEQIMARGEVEVYNDEQDFSTEGPKILPLRRVMPGTQIFPGRSSMQTPDGLVYEQSSSRRPSWNERQEVHEEYAEEGEEDAAMSEMHMGALRVADDANLDQLDIIASVAASVIQAGATGYGIYSKIAADKRAKKAEAEASKQAAIQSAAMFNQTFSQNYAQSLGPQPPPGMTLVPAAPTVAPFGTGVDWGKVALYGGGALVLVGFTWLLVRK